MSAFSILHSATAYDTDVSSVMSFTALKKWDFEYALLIVLSTGDS